MSTQAKRGIPVITISFEKTDVVKALDTLAYVLNSHMGKSSATLLIANIADVLDNERGIGDNTHEHYWVTDHDGYVQIHLDEHALKAQVHFLSAFVPLVNVVVSAIETFRSMLLVINHRQAWGRLTSVFKQQRVEEE
jgi:hypothetical protein